MPKIAFMGAGSTVFAKNILGDVLCTPALQDSHIALYDIDGQRLRDSKRMMDNLNANINQDRAKVTAHLGVANRRKALKGADYVVNAVQVGGYRPSTVIDFEVPKKHGLRQTIGDTLGIGGIFRALRTIPVVLDFCRDMEEVCPDAWFLNYVNPMAMITSAILRAGRIRAVGLCHSVQGCARWLLGATGLLESVKELRWKIAGINHQAWLLEIADGKTDLYPAVRKRAAELADKVQQIGAAKVLEQAKAKHAERWWRDDPLGRVACDLVRFEIMRRFGYYVTESSEHSAEYMPWFIKSSRPELIERFNIPLDEYPRRCEAQIAGWERLRKDLVQNAKLSHTRGHEYGSHIMEAIETGNPARVHGSVMNTGGGPVHQAAGRLITNLPAKACVEVACLVDRNGVQPCFVGDLPEACAAINRTNINVQILTVEAALEQRKDLVYQAAMLDPHTGAEMTLDEIRSMCDDLIEAHGDMLPRLR